MPDNTRQSSSSNLPESGRFAYDGLERALHEKARLGIMTSLLSHPHGLLFNDLKSLCNLTDGNLSRHLQILKEAGFVEVWKGERGNRTVSLCRLSEEGRERFLSYVGELEKVIRDATRNADQRDRQGSATDTGENGSWTQTHGLSPA